MGQYFEGFRTLPPHGIAGLCIVLLYAIQTEIRFGTKARSHRAGASDRGSTIALAFAAMVPVLGFALAMKASAYPWIPRWFRDASLPAMPWAAWLGILVGVLGLAVRVWAVLTLRERYTRTLLTEEGQALERRGPYGWVRHPGYLGSLLCLNGVAMASGNYAVLIASLAVTVAAYAHRMRAEDEMLLEAFGQAYAAYRREVAAVIPFLR